MDEAEILAIAKLTGRTAREVESTLGRAETEVHRRAYVSLSKLDAPTLDALKTEISGGAKGWSHAMWLHSVKSDFEDGEVSKGALESIRKRHGILDKGAMRS
jgi:hypothetical protein